MSESPSLSALVDLERYPLEDDADLRPSLRAAGSAQGVELRESPRLSAHGRRRAMTSEVLDAIPRAYRREQILQCVR